MLAAGLYVSIINAAVASADSVASKISKLSSDKLSLPSSPGSFKSSSKSILKFVLSWGTSASFNDCPSSKPNIDSPVVVLFSILILWIPSWRAITFILNEVSPIFSKSTFKDSKSGTKI